MDITGSKTKIADMEEKIQSLSQQATTAEAADKARIEAEIATLKKDKETIENDVHAAEKIGSEAASVEGKAKDILGGLHL